MLARHFEFFHQALLSILAVCRSFSYIYRAHGALWIDFLEDFAL